MDTNFLIWTKTSNYKFKKLHTQNRLQNTKKTISRYIVIEHPKTKEIPKQANGVCVGAGNAQVTRGRK